jgi:biopolymer transport protein ExbB
MITNSRSLPARALVAAAFALCLVAPPPVLAQESTAPPQQAAPVSPTPIPEPGAPTPPPPAAAAPAGTGSPEAPAAPVIPPPSADASAQAPANPPPADAKTQAPANPPPSVEPPPAHLHEPVVTPAPPPAAPETPTDASAQGAKSVEAEKLPRDLSPWSMFVSADMVVKSVMIGLIFASFVTWTVWFAKSIEIFASKRRAARALREISDARSLSEVANLMEPRRGLGPALVKAAVLELRASWVSGASMPGLRERISSRLERLELAAVRDINRGTGVLATIGSTAPFVGLFGTVWGIMNSFIGISEAQTTNLAIVAPGIAEALLATAFGLVAAIPAVIFYNQLARSIGGYKALVGDTGAAVLRLVSRDFDRGAGLELRAAE